MASSSENQETIEQLEEWQERINLELERLEQAQLHIEHGSPAWQLLEEESNQFVTEFSRIQDELDSIQVEEELNTLKRLGWKLASCETMDGVLIKKYVPPDSPELRK